mmetsp:Transcript_16071/g.26845  ORF Transcript_16071/g.26845 Transcript_16071/m.26845 type:complete len:292 (+) Transcript_16071:87-962(+)|eukprot:CAMPEP_0119004148 /NCGR_PEP_ID=MMETSP1176-20130426/981_1 /TAXON_ID=265551 /ORGANISM="Synedropsis recta cf, Strain CCMP1620" /LENGTH=291 /DNA_ID=CAMNT_0006955825 /DNA_START=26 /DNA_END=901 /DNA_ORIENTATION=-
MSDHCEEQEMEAEALEAIFDQAFEVVHGEQPFKWSVKLLPVDCAGDEEAEEAENHVGIKLFATIPLDYPESLPELNVEVIKGLTDEHASQLAKMATEEAQSNEGMPAIFGICELLREWLNDNNAKGLDDASMHAQMMRRAKEEEQKKKLAEREFESQKQAEALTETETEELTVRRRRAEGTPCIQEHFDVWREAFAKEMAEKEAEEEAIKQENGKKSKEKIVDKSGRISGFLHFTGKAGKNLEEMEKAAEEAEIDPDELDVDEDLFDLDSDEDDLDDMDFDDDDDEEEPDI